MKFDFQKFIASENFTKLVIGVGILLSVLIVFQAGVYVGARKAALSSRLGENYYYRVIGPDDRFTLPGQTLPDADGAAGKILSVNLPTFLIEDRDHGEKTVLISSATAIKRLRDATSSEAIIPGEFAIVIGEPNESGQVKATFIRLVPPPPAQ